MDNQRIAWITGANKGIGEAIAKLGAEKGFLIAASSRLKGDIPSNAIRLFRCDVQSPEEIQNCYQEIQSELGGIDILINNAGVGTFAPLWETSLEEADAMFGTNLRGIFLCSKAVLPAMIARKSGIIVNILSVAAVKTFSHCAVYSATKAGALAMSRSLREDVRGFGIRIIDILPGATETEIWDAESRAEFHDRMMQPDDIAQVVWEAIELSLEGRMVLEEIIVRSAGGDL